MSCNWAAVGIPIPRPPAHYPDQHSVRLTGPRVPEEQVTPSKPLFLVWALSVLVAPTSAIDVSIRTADLTLNVHPRFEADFHGPHRTAPPSGTRTAALRPARLTGS